MGCYFLTYEALVQRHLRVNGGERGDISPLWAVGYGAAAGYGLWFRLVFFSPFSFAVEGIQLQSPESGPTRLPPASLGADVQYLPNRCHQVKNPNRRPGPFQASI